MTAGYKSLQRIAKDYRGYNLERGNMGLQGVQVVTGPYKGLQGATKGYRGLKVVTVVPRGYRVIDRVTGVKRC